MARGRKGSYCLHWTVILHTKSEPIAMRLLDRMLGRLDLDVSDVCLRPWGEKLDRYAASFTSPWAAAVDDASCLGKVLQTASQLSATWTLEFADGSLRPRNDSIVLRAWTPHEYRKFALEGIDAATFVLEDRGRNADPIATESRTARVVQRTLPGGLVVRVVRQGGE